MVLSSFNDDQKSIPISVIIYSNVSFSIKLVEPFGYFIVRRPLSPQKAFATDFMI